MNKISSSIKLLTGAMTSKRLFSLVVILSACCLSSYAAATGLETVSSDIKSYIVVAKNIVYAIAGVCSIVGAFSIYFKMNNGDQDVKKTIMLVVGGCAALLALATALPAMFGN